LLGREAFWWFAFASLVLMVKLNFFTDDLSFVD
jgi:hypothetical protein